jgi:hypothetical protein
MIALTVIRANMNYWRANSVAREVINHTESMYEQIQENRPAESTLIETQQPNSETFAFGLSDGSTRYAYVVAEQIYTSPATLGEIVSSYDDVFIETGWLSVPLTRMAGNISSAYHHPLENHLIAGVCEAQEASDEPNTLTYSVFFYYSEVGCSYEISQGDPLYCVASDFCKE